MGTSKRVGAMMIDSYPGNRMFCDGNIEVKLEMRSDGQDIRTMMSIRSRIGFRDGTSVRRYTSY
jgi:hypothetical protein